MSACVRNMVNSIMNSKSTLNALVYIFTNFYFYRIIDALSLSSKFVPVFYEMACVLQELLGKYRTA